MIIVDYDSYIKKNAGIIKENEWRNKNVSYYSGS